MYPYSVDGVPVWLAVLLVCTIGIAGAVGASVYRQAGHLFNHNDAHQKHIARGTESAQRAAAAEPAAAEEDAAAEEAAEEPASAPPPTVNLKGKPSTQVAQALPATT